MTTYQDQVRQFERMIIRDAIPYATTITQLAKNLGTKRSTLVMRAKSLGIFEELPRDRAVPRTMRQKLEDANREQA